jgi:hypothetical protein
LNPDNPEARRLVDLARPEIDAGHFARAHELLREATQAQIAAGQEARKLKEQAQAAEDAQMLGAASSTAAEGDVALTERNYLQAADLFGQAAGYVPGDHSIERNAFLRGGQMRSIGRATNVATTPPWHRRFRFTNPLCKRRRANARHSTGRGLRTNSVLRSGNWASARAERASLMTPQRPLERRWKNSLASARR